jgi:hypothetical protein
VLFTEQLAIFLLSMKSISELTKTPDGAGFLTHIRHSFSG